LAIAQAWQGRRLGTFLLLDAIHRVLLAGTSMAIYAVVVDAKTERAVDFYRGFGLIAFPSRNDRLFLPLETFVKAGL
jgi:GNAT superfamily N-acetyltransferase